MPGLSGLGTSVVPLVGRHPLALAAQSLTAQAALDGRFTLGVGPSHALVTEGFFGEPYDRPFTRTAEFVAALAPLLRGGTADVAGDIVETHGWLTIESDPCPLLLAALGPRMLDLAGRVADGTTVGSCGPRTIATHIAPAIGAAADGAGRPAPAYPGHGVRGRHRRPRGGPCRGGRRRRALRPTARLPARPRPRGRRHRRRPPARRHAGSDRGRGRRLRRRRCHRAPARDRLGRPECRPGRPATRWPTCWAADARLSSGRDPGRRRSRGSRWTG